MITFKRKVQTEETIVLCTRPQDKSICNHATREDLDAALASLGLKAVPKDAIVMDPNSSCAAAASTDPKPASLSAWRYDVDGREIKVGDIVQPYAKTGGKDEYGEKYHPCIVNRISHLFDCGGNHKYSNRNLCNLPYLRIISR